MRVCAAFGWSQRGHVQAPACLSAVPRYLRRPRTGPAARSEQAMANQDFLFDKRIVQRNIDKGLIEGKDLEKRLKGLTDLTEAATVTSFDTVVAAADGEDEGSTSDDSDEE